MDRRSKFSSLGKVTSSICSGCPGLEKIVSETKRSFPEQSFFLGPQCFDKNARLLPHKSRWPCVKRSIWVVIFKGVGDHATRLKINACFSFLSDFIKRPP